MVFFRLNCCNDGNFSRCAHARPAFDRRPRYSGGFSLLEVMVSILIVALGVMGVAGMQLAASRTTQQSALQTIALQLASEMAEKMRANDSQMKKLTGNSFLKVDYASATSGEPAPPQKLCYDASCSGAELAAFDIYEWEMRIRSALPEGRAKICRDILPWDPNTRTLTWECKADGTEGAAPLVIKIGWQAKNADGTLLRSVGKEFPPSVVIPVEPYVQ